MNSHCTYDTDDWHTICSALFFMSSAHNRRLRRHRAFPTLLSIAEEYEHPSRFYHNSHHLAEGFRELHRFEKLLEQPLVAHYAWLNHDRVYTADSKLNEVWSAELAVQDGRKIGLEHCEYLAAKEMILATITHKVPSTEFAHRGDVALMLDIDLSALGADRETFIVDGDNIRAEFCGRLSNEAWNAGRAAFASAMLSREQIFVTPQYAHLEERARQNLTWAVKMAEMKAA